MEVWLAKQAKSAPAGALREPTPAEALRAKLVAQGGREWCSDALEYRVYFNDVTVGAGVASFYFSGSEVFIVAKKGCTEKAVRAFATNML